MEGRRDERKDGSMEGLRIEGWMEGRINGWINKCKNEWIDG